MLFYSKNQITEELKNITTEEEFLKPVYQNYISMALGESIDEADKTKIREGLIDLYEKKLYLIGRLTGVMTAIDEYWLSLPAGDESEEMTRLYNKAREKSDVIGDQAYQIRQLIHSLI